MCDEFASCRFTYITVNKENLNGIVICWNILVSLKRMHMPGYLEGNTLESEEGGRALDAT